MQPIDKVKGMFSKTWNIFDRLDKFITIFFISVFLSYFDKKWLKVLVNFLCRVGYSHYLLGKSCYKFDLIIHQESIFLS